MHIGVVIGRLQAYEADQGMGIALDGKRHLIDQLHRCRQIRRVTQPNVLEHGLEGFAGLTNDLAGLMQLLAGADGLDLLGGLLI